AARWLVEFVCSPERRLAAAGEVERLPARLALPADSLPDWVRDVRRRMVVADVDWNLLAEHGPEWMRWWDQHVRGTGHQEGSRRWAAFSKSTRSKSDGGTAGRSPRSRSTSPAAKSL